MGQSLPHPGIAVREEAGAADQSEQYQFFNTLESSYRVFVTDVDAPLDPLVGVYRGPAPVVSTRRLI
jgi:hypothetical protein